MTVSKWYTYIGPSTDAVRRGQAVRVVQNGFGRWAGRVKVSSMRGAVATVPRHLVAGPGAPSAPAALGLCWVG
jgi:hypothetical protein